MRGNKFRGTSNDIKLEGSSVTKIHLGENDVRDGFTVLGGGASAATVITEFAVTHKGVETFEHHIVASNGGGLFNFSAAPGAAATSASRNVGTDVMGKVVYSTAGGTTGTLFTVTFGRAYATAPEVFLGPTDTRAAQAGLYVSGTTTTTFTVACANAHAAGTSFLPFWVVGN